MKDWTGTTSTVEQNVGELNKFEDEKGVVRWAFLLLGKTFVADNPFSIVFANNLHVGIARNRNERVKWKDWVSKNLLDHVEWKDYRHRLNHVAVQLISADFARRSNSLYQFHHQNSTLIPVSSTIR